MSPPLLVLEPSRVWHTRAAWFSLIFLLIVLVAGVFVRLVWILAPFVIYRGLYSLRFLQPGRVGIDVYEEKLICKPAFGKRLEVKKTEVVRFMTVYRGTNEVVVARRKDVEVLGTQGRQLMHKSDLVMPAGLMRSPGLVRRLEAWRTGNLESVSLIPSA